MQMMLMRIRPWVQVEERLKKRRNTREVPLLSVARVAACLVVVVQIPLAMTVFSKWLRLGGSPMKDVASMEGSSQANAALRL